MIKKEAHNTFKLTSSLDSGNDQKWKLLWKFTANSSGFELDDKNFLGQ